ncbi:hypothetical protein AC579_4402 [Pseudocercospora musae]|uniref:Fungal N-terminal domain-containing protein n=1 Tax=Pseudocercospora musae TaxID=113226 RepID=A0A139HEY0_9PEZI|nr:hypothetical protein AC579_4402 [Pseudocercospora musae]
MAEAGLVFGIIALVGTGTKLAISTFDFATTLGGAGRELQIVATEISTFSSTLRQLQGVLDHAHFKPTSQAISTVQQITKHCAEVFKDIEERVTSLRGVKDDGNAPTSTAFFPTPDFVEKVKWTFKKPKVMEMRSTLEACKSTLNVMLNTMLLAERVSRRDHSTRNNVEDEEDKVVTQSLVIAQQCALEQLEHYEDEADKEQEIAMLLPGIHAKTRANVSQRRKSRGRLIRMFSGLSVITDLPMQAGDVSKMPSRADRASLWLDSVLAPAEDSHEPHPGHRRQKRLSSAGTATAPFQLLKKWTDQADKLHPTLPIQAISSEAKFCDPWTSSEPSFTRIHQAPPVNEAAHCDALSGTGLTLRRASTDLISPRTGRLHSTGHHKIVGSDGSLEIGSGVSDQNQEDDCDDVLSSIIRDYGISHVNEKVALCVYHGGKTRVLKATDKPIQVLKQYEEMEVEARLFVRYIGSR